MPVNLSPWAEVLLVLVEVGFLSSPHDETALKSHDLSAAIVEAIVDTVSEVRRDGSSTPAPAGTGTP